jgi:hypothetical protein
MYALGIRNMYCKIKLQSQEYPSLAFTSFIIVIILMLLLLFSYSLSHRAFAASPAFDEVLISDQELKNLKSHWAHYAALPHLLDI